jgi:hypothetical protein
VLLTACAVLITSLGLSETAHASLFLSRTQATQAANTVARRNASGTVRTAAASCRPTGRRPTPANLRSRWRLWDCAWSVQFQPADASIASCTGRLRLTGTRTGSSYRMLSRRSCAQVSPPPRPASTPSPIQSVPTPAPAASPTPVPAPQTNTRASQMVNQAMTYGIGRAEELRRSGGTSSGSFYFGQMEPTLCQFLNATKVRCPLYMWWEQSDMDRNFYSHTTREIFQMSVFVEDLGTSVGFNSSMEPQSVLSFEFNRPYYMICSTWFSGTPACPASRLPIAYPPGGPPYRN